VWFLSQATLERPTKHLKISNDFAFVLFLPFLLSSFVTLNNYLNIHLYSDQAIDKLSSPFFFFFFFFFFKIALVYSIYILRGTPNSSQKPQAKDAHPPKPDGKLLPDSREW